MNDEVRDLITSGQTVIRMENETMQALTVARPRPPVRAILEKALEELEALPEFAASNFYVIPYKEKRDDPNSKTVNVEGLSVKASLVLLRHFRNAMVGGQFVGADERNVFIQGAALDVENNVRVQRPKSVSRWGYSGGKEYLLSEAKLEQKTQAELSKVIRNAVLSIIPEPIKMAYYKRAKEIAANPSLAAGGKGQKVEALSVRVDRMFAFFLKNYGVDVPKILEYLSGLENATLKTSAVDLTDADLGDLIGVANALKDKEATVEDYFGHAKAEPTAQASASQLMEDLKTSQVQTTAGTAADPNAPGKGSPVRQDEPGEANATPPAQTDGAKSPKPIKATKQPKKPDVFDQAIQANEAKAAQEKVDTATGEINPPESLNSANVVDLFGGKVAEDPVEDCRLKLATDIRSAMISVWPSFPLIDSLEQKHRDYIAKLLARSFLKPTWEEVKALKMFELEAGLVQFEGDINFVRKSLKKDPLHLVGPHTDRRKAAGI
jgi:hypothetical protein